MNQNGFPREENELSYPLLKFSDHEASIWRLSDAVRGVQIFGGIGSGKSSGSGRTIALKFLQAGYGGIVLTGKVDEAKVWVDYAIETGRLDRLVLFGEKEAMKEKFSDRKYRGLDFENYIFDPLEYESTREGHGANQTLNIVAMFMSIVKMGNRVGGSGAGSSKEPFWDMAMERCITAAVDLLDVSGQPKTVPNIAKVIQEAPLGADVYGRFQKLYPVTSIDQQEDLQKWAAESYTVFCLTWALSNIEEHEKKPEPEQQAWKLQGRKRAFEVARSYFLSEFPRLPDRTRSSITEMFYAFANPFRSGLLADFFTGETSYQVKPEQTYTHQKIIILDFSVKEYLQAGVYAQSLYKRIWQQAIERRDTKLYPVPVFMWIDESQYFLNEDDMMFQTTARSAKACTVLISQNISNYYATIGGEYRKERVDSLLGNLATKIFHNNNDHVTNEWAADTIGQEYAMSISYGTNEDDKADSRFGEELRHQVLPKDFILLKTGGEKNEGLVTAYLTIADRDWGKGTTFAKVKFQQDL
ncbi:MAG: TraM recognition domain-containing protein [Saprospiraceae bacterium]